MRDNVCHSKSSSSRDARDSTAEKLRRFRLFANFIGNYFNSIRKTCARRTQIPRTTFPSRSADFAESFLARIAGTPAKFSAGRCCKFNQRRQIFVHVVSSDEMACDDLEFESMVGSIGPTTSACLRFILFPIADVVLVKCILSRNMFQTNKKLIWSPPWGPLLTFG